MDDLVFTRQEIFDLADKLGAIELSDRERTLLLAIFAAAAARSNPAGAEGGATLPAYDVNVPLDDAGDDEEADLAGLKQQLLNAYIPGQSFIYVIRSKIGTPPWPPPPKIGEPPPPEGE